MNELYFWPFTMCSPRQEVERLAEPTSRKCVDFYPSSKHSTMWSVYVLQLLKKKQPKKPSRMRQSLTQLSAQQFLLPDHWTMMSHLTVTAVT